MKRRDFLKISAGAAGAVFISSVNARAVSPDDKDMSSMQIGAGSGGNRILTPQEIINQALEVLSDNLTFN